LSDAVREVLVWLRINRCRPTPKATVAKSRAINVKKGRVPIAATASSTDALASIAAGKQATNPDTPVPTAATASTAGMIQASSAVAAQAADALMIAKLLRKVK
jgi:hypothetical protein